MKLFRLLLVAIIITVGFYTALVIPVHGLSFFPPYFADIAKLNWPGQFNMDFSCMLMLGSLWLMWRHHFSPLGFLFGLMIVPGGAPFLSTYLLVASFQANGDVKELLLGKQRVAA
jgi:hypothetical protein